MRVSVAENRTIYIEQNYNTQNENEATTIQLQVPEKYQDYNKKIVFITDEGMVWDLFQNDEYVLTSAITRLEKVQFYIWLTKGDKDFRSQTRELVFIQNDGEPSATPEEVDGVKTVVALLDEEIEKVEDLEADVTQALSQVNTAIEQTNNLDLDVNKQEKTTTVELTKKDGTKKTAQIDDGVSLQFMWQGTRLGIKTENQQEYTFVDLQGIQGERGEMGEPFTVRKTYASIAEMNADFNNMQIGDYVMIASSVEIEDNAKLYTRGENAWIFISDFSGAMGIKGETGATPNIQIGTVASGNAPSVTRTGTAENPFLNFILEKGEKGDKGNTGDTGATGNGIANIQKTSTSGLVDTYTITYTDGTTATYEVTNGEDGEVTQAQLDEVIAENEYLNSVIEQAFDEVSAQGENVTLENTIEARFKKAPLPRGNTTQATRSGKNRLYIPDGNLTSNGITTIAENGILQSTGTKTGTESVFYLVNNQSIKNIPVGDYIVSIDETISDFNLIFGFFGTSWTDVIINKNTKSKTITFAEEKNKIAIYASVVESGIVVNKTIKPMIRLASIEDDTYEEYGAMPSPEFESPIQNVSGDVNVTVCNENLWDEQWRNGYYDNNGNFVANSVYVANKYPIPVEPETIYTSIVGEDLYIDELFCYDKDMNFLGTATRLTNPKRKTLANTTYVQFRTNQAYGGTYKNDVALFKSDIAKPYVEHQEQDYTLNLGNIELCKIGDYQDYIYKVDGKWYKHEVVEKASFDGSEIYELLDNSSYSDSILRFRCEIAGKMPGVGSTFKDLIISNHFKVFPLDFDARTRECIAGQNATKLINIFIDKSNLVSEDVPGLKTWLGENNVIVQYILQEPQEIEITNAHQIAQLEAIEKATSYKDTTHIYSTNELSPIFDVVALGKEQ